MKDIEFNLLDEKWILVRKSDCTVDELSLTDALLKSHEYVELAGELPTQNVSILRLMLAVLHTVFSRYSPQGEPAPLYDSDDCRRSLERALECRPRRKNRSRSILHRCMTDFGCFIPTGRFIRR